MAEITLTTANKNSSATTMLHDVQWGETISEGNVVYKKTSAGLYWKSHCETSAATANVAGIAVDGGAVDTYGSIAIEGPVVVDSSLTVAEYYVLATDGKIQPVGDLASNDYICGLGFATATNVLDLKITYTGTQK